MKTKNWYMWEKSYSLPLFRGLNSIIGLYSLTSLPPKYTNGLRNDEKIINQDFQRALGFYEKENSRGKQVQNSV